MGREGICFHRWHHSWTRCCVSSCNVRPRAVGEEKMMVTCFRNVATDATWSSMGSCCMGCRLVRAGHKPRPPLLSTSRAKLQCWCCPIFGLSHALGRHVFVEAASRLDFIACSRCVCMCILLEEFVWMLYASRFSG